MFRSKKNDFHTVQFIPEYSSSSRAASKKRVSAGKRKLALAVAVAIILVVVAAVAAAAYFTYFSPYKQFIKAYNSEDFTECHTICSENAYDPAFLAGISPVIESTLTTTLDQYRSGELDAGAAEEILSRTSEITDGNFDEDILKIRNDISSIEGIYSDISDAEALMASKKFDEAVVSLKKAAETADAQGIDVSDEISSLINDNFSMMKCIQFYKFASQVKASDFDSINKTIDFMTTYVKDSDYTDFKALADKVKAGTVRPSAAAKTASAVAEKAYVQSQKDAAGQAEADKNSGSADVQP